DESHGAISLGHPARGKSHARCTLRVGRWLLPCRSEAIATRRAREEALFVRRATLSLQPASRRLLVERTQMGPAVSQRAASGTEAGSCVTQARTCVTLVEACVSVGRACVLPEECCVTLGVPCDTERGTSDTRGTTSGIAVEACG